MGKMPGAGMRLGTGARGPAALPSSMGRLNTGVAQDGAARPMTAVRAAGYTSAGYRGQKFKMVLVI